MQVTATLRHSYTATRLSKIKKYNNIKLNKDDSRVLNITVHTTLENKFSLS
jgi:hypothetical protein